MSHVVGRARSDYLTGWKEISSYLGVSPRTAQLWEKKYGLPVKRIGGSQGAVRVLVAELDEWRRRRAVEEDRVETEAEAAELDDIEAVQSPRTRGSYKRIGVGGVLLAAVLAVVAWRVRPTEFVVSPPDRVVEMPAVTKDPIWISMSPDGARAAVAATLAGSTSARLQVLDISTGDLETIHKRSIRRAPVAWSPDGRRIAFHAGASRLYEIPAEGGEARLITNLPRNNVLGMDWHDDGERILISNMGAGILEVDVKTGVATPLLSHPRVEDAQYIQHEGQKLVLFSSEDGSPEEGNPLTIPFRVSILDPDTGSVVQLFTLANSYPRVSYHPDGYVLHTGGTVPRPKIIATPIGERAIRSSGGPVLVSPSGHAASVTKEGAIGVLAGDDLTLKMLWIGQDGERVGEIGKGPLYWVRGPRISPDGQRALVFGADGVDGGFWIVGPGERSLVTAFGYLNSGSSAWSPDGEVVAHTMYENDDQVVQFVRADDRFKRWSIAPGGLYLPEQWSQDGKTLLGTKIADKGNRLLWLLPVDGSGPGRAVFEAPGDHWDARWSPDERLMSYGRVLDGERHVFVRWADAPVDDPGVIVAEGRQPRWVKGGAELIYERGGVLYAVAIRTEGDQIVAGEPDQERFKLPTHTDKRMYDVAPDGERILVAHPPSENPRPFAIEVWSNLELP